MLRITITCSIPDEYADPGHSMGVTNKGYEEITEALMAVGAEDVDIERAG